MDMMSFPPNPRKPSDRPGFQTRRRRRSSPFLRFLQTPPFLLPGNLEITPPRSAGNFEFVMLCYIGSGSRKPRRKWAGVCYLESTLALPARQGMDMNVVIDPIWPWLYWLTFWASATGDVLAAIVLSSLMAFVLPICWQLRPRGITPRQLVRIGGATLAMGVGWTGRWRRERRHLPTPKTSASTTTAKWDR